MNGDDSKKKEDVNSEGSGKVMNSRKSIQQLEEKSKVAKQDNRVPSKRTDEGDLALASTSIPFPSPARNVISSAEEQQQQNSGDIQEEIAIDEETPIQAYRADEDVTKSKKSKKKDEVLIEGVVEKAKFKSNRTFNLLLITVWLLMVVGLVVGLSLGLSGRNGDEVDEVITPDSLLPSSVPTVMVTQSPTVSPSASMVPSAIPSNAPTSLEFVTVLQQIAIQFPTLPVNINDSTSPSYRAAEWLTGQQLGYDLPISPDDLLSLIDFRQRYALSVFYYSTGGHESWIDKCQFLNTSVHYCDWECPLPEAVLQSETVIFQLQPNSTTMGVKCAETDAFRIATGLAFSK